MKSLSLEERDHAVTAPKLGSVVFDCRDVDRMVTFWSGLLETGERTRIADAFVWLEPTDEGAPSIAFQKVEEPTAGKNKLHLDFGSTDRDGVIARIEELGGRRIDEHEVAGFEWTVLEDVEGNQFCVAASG